MKKASILFSFIASSFAAMAQDSTGKAADPSLEAAGVKITGSVDAYYRYNFSDPAAFDAFNGTHYGNNYTSFTNSQNSFELGMASIQGSHSFGKASAFIDLGFGRRAEEFNYANPDHPTLFALKQAYLSYAVTDKFKLTLGKWATHIGYELADAYLNRNYSMAYMFSFGPFSHTGLKADVGLGGKSALMIGIANTTDQITTTLSRKYAIAQFSTASGNDKVKAYLNYQGSFGGSYSLNQLDLVLTGAVSDQFSIAYNGTFQAVKPDSGDGDLWWGSALYFNYDPVSNFGITLRGEYFDNKKAVAFYAPYTSVLAVTLSPNFKVGNLTIIPEVRVDAGKDEVFRKNDGGTTKTTVSGLLAATYHF